MIYCVVPRPLADELYPKLLDHYERRGERDGHHRPSRVRPPCPPRQSGARAVSAEGPSGALSVTAAGHVCPATFPRSPAPSSCIRRHWKAPGATGPSGPDVPARLRAMKLIVHVDGGARGNPGPAAAACVISSPAGEVLAEHTQLLGTATNNVAEYRALLLGLQRARELGAGEVEVIGDSELIAKQVQGLYKVKHEAMKPAAPARRWPPFGASTAGRSEPFRAPRTRAPTRSSTRPLTRARRIGSRGPGVHDRAAEPRIRPTCAPCGERRSVQRLGRAGDREHLSV